MFYNCAETHFFFDFRRSFKHVLKKKCIWAGANRKLWFAEKSAFTLFRLMVKIDFFSFFTLLAQQRLDGNGAVHQADTFIFRMFIYACIFKRRILVTAELKNDIVHLSFVENSNTKHQT